MRDMRSGLIGCLLVAFAASGCGGQTAISTPSAGEQQQVAGRFATALLQGDAVAARALLAPRRDGALEFLVQQAVAPWKAQHASIQLPARRIGKYWTVSFARQRAQRDGTFERQRGNLVVSIAPSAAGASVAFFALENVHTRFSTHRDSQLLPSKR